MRVVLRLSLLLLIAAACHRPLPTSGDAGGLRNLITQAEIDSTHAANIYDVISRLRGDFLRDRGTISIKTNQHERAVVFLANQEYGIPETMRNIPSGRIAEIRFYPGTDAVIRFGAQYGGGVIQLIPRYE